MARPLFASRTGTLALRLSLGVVATLLSTVLSVLLTILALGIPRHEALLIGPLVGGALLGGYLRTGLAGFLFALVPAVLLSAATAFLTALAYMSTHSVSWFDQYLFLFYGAGFLGAATLTGVFRQTLKSPSRP